jgi:hypothetical protein
VDESTPVLIGAAISGCFLVVALSMVLSVGNKWTALRELRGLSRPQGRELMNMFLRNRPSARVASRLGMLLTALAFDSCFASRSSYGS